MVPPSTPSRRALLAGVGAGIATSLTGCSGSDSSQSTPDGGTLVTDYTVVVARTNRDQPPICAPRERSDDGGSTDESSPTPEPVGTLVVESESDAGELVVDEDAIKSATVRRFLAETTYTAQSVVIFQRQVRERLGRISRTAEELIDVLEMPPTR